MNSIYYTPNLTSEQQEYMSQYRDICEGARNREIVGYVERHHIHPICLGGPDVKENKVKLTAREHFEVHFLLIKIFPGSSGLAFACHRMSCDKRGRKIDGEEYEVLKIAHAKALSLLHKGKTKENDEGVARMAATLTGRNKGNHEGVARIAEALTGRNKGNHEGVARMAVTLTGRRKETHAGVAAQAEALTGRNKENDESVAQMAATLTGRRKETHDGPRKISETLSNRTMETHSYIADIADQLRGRTKESHEYLRISGEKRRKLSKEQELKLFEMREAGISQKEVVEYFNGKGIDIKKSSISTIYNRIKKEAFNVE